MNESGHSAEPTVLRFDVEAVEAQLRRERFPNNRLVIGALTIPVLLAALSLMVLIHTKTGPVPLAVGAVGTGLAVWVGAMWAGERRSVRQAATKLLADGSLTSDHRVWLTADSIVLEQSDATIALPWHAIESWVQAGPLISVRGADCELVLPVNDASADFTADLKRRLDLTGTTPDLTDDSRHQPARDNMASQTGTVQFLADEHLAVSSLDLMTARMHRPRRYFLACMVPAVGVVLALLGAPWLALGLVLALVCVVVLLDPAFQRWQLRRTIRAIPVAQRRVTAEFAADGWRTRTDAGVECSGTWSSVSTWIDDKEVLLVFPETGGLQHWPIGQFPEDTSSLIRSALTQRGAKLQTP